CRVGLCPPLFGPRIPVRSICIPPALELAANEMETCRAGTDLPLRNGIRVPAPLSELHRRGADALATGHPNCRFRWPAPTHRSDCAGERRIRRRATALLSPSAGEGQSGGP